MGCWPSSGPLAVMASMGMLGRRFRHRRAARALGRDPTPDSRGLRLADAALPDATHTFLTPGNGYAFGTAIRHHSRFTETVPQQCPDRPAVRFANCASCVASSPRIPSRFRQPSDRLPPCGTAPLATHRCRVGSIKFVQRRRGIPRGGAETEGEWRARMLRRACRRSAPV